MDPITHASKLFLAEAEAFWRERPGEVLPMIAECSERGDVVNALRLEEHAPENRRPLFLYEASFEQPKAYFDGLAESVRQDYEHIRWGAQEEGVTLPPFLTGGEAGRCELPALRQAVLHVERAAAQLGDRFDGVLLALLPARVVNGTGWRDSIATLARARVSPRVRIAVFTPPGGPLGGILDSTGAHLRIDHDELMRHLQVGVVNDGPAGVTPAPTPLRLRELLLDAAAASAAGKHAAAAGLYRRARTLCKAEGLKIEEAMVLIALGGACLAAGAPKLAIESYAEAAALAHAAEAWQVACQAWLGAGGAHMGRRAYPSAATAYGAAADAASRADAAVLRIEALRMEGTCFLLGGAEQDALRAWRQAVDIGTGLGVAERRASTFAEVRGALIDLESRSLVRRGGAGPAELIRGRDRIHVPTRQLFAYHGHSQDGIILMPGSDDTKIDSR